MKKKKRNVEVIRAAIYDDKLCPSSLRHLKLSHRLVEEPTFPNQTTLKCSFFMQYYIDFFDAINISQVI